MFRRLMSRPIKQRSNLMNRREARKQAFILLFQLKFQAEDMNELVSDFFKSTKTGVQKEYIESVVTGTIEKLSEIDAVLSEYSKDWDIDRISSVSLAALRLGAYELLYLEDIPSAVSVSEAVSLAKEFEGEEAAPFVNGILGKLKDNLEKK